MLVPTLLVRCGHAYQVTADRNLVSHHHQRLIKNQYWECSSPSQSLGVLAVLVRSGTLVEKLDKAASGALNAMSPSMTKNEQALLGRMSSFLNLTGVVDSVSTLSEKEKPSLPNSVSRNEVLALYEQFVRYQQKKNFMEMKPVVILSSLVHDLDAISSLMFLEMVITTSFQTDAPWRDKENISALLTRLRYHIMYSKMIQFKAVWWLLDILSNSDSFLFQYKEESTRLFKACLRRINELLPQLSVGECLLVFPLLDTSVYDRPFIICASIMKRLLASDLNEFVEVPNSVILRVLGCKGLNLSVFRKLCQILQKDYRIGEFVKEDCLFLLSTLATRFSTVEIDENNMDHFCESFFAQLYVNAKIMSPVECVSALEYLERMSLSGFFIFPSSDLLERLKKKTFIGIGQSIKRTDTSLKDIEVNIEIMRRLEGVLRRCVLLPFVSSDVVKVKELMEKLTLQRRHMERSAS
ncbi:uncharacterized protein TM35_000431900 [Trypanosoma theileri]|uniref:Mitochondrial RNA binding protein n=1 Tax=Trypanosoma theileri TaxID=67003 RepID=A0A1X0NIQ1_9TRYP|nr:uncharacterized protein TM35_000431900 [Trypanosoma theileri]ORC84622.1 hypothetical protein TM35_000431900 [Trypanosoma theileri]